MSLWYFCIILPLSNGVWFSSENYATQFRNLQLHMSELGCYVYAVQFLIFIMYRYVLLTWHPDISCRSYILCATNHLSPSSCLVLSLPLPSFSSCIWNLLFTFCFFRSLFPGFLITLVLSTVLYIMMLWSLLLCPNLLCVSVWKLVKSRTAYVHENLAYTVSQTTQLFFWDFRFYFMQKVKNSMSLVAM